MPAFIVDCHAETETTTWTETVEERDPETGEVTSTSEVEHTDTSESLVIDWDGPGTFYYKKDQTQALVLTDEDDPARQPAFTSAADIEAMIDGGEFDLPTPAFEVLSQGTWTQEPAPEPEVVTP